MTVTAIGPFDQGDLVKVFVGFTDTTSTAAVDPSPLTATVKVISTGTSTTYTYGVETNFVKLSTGNYILAVDTTAAGGRYKVRFKTPTGHAYQFSEQFEFYVNADTL